MARRSLSGARAIVTGASSGIGRELARELARRGGRVVLAARRRERLEATAAEVTSLGGEARLVTGDITSPEIHAALVEAAQSAWGGLDLLINNAGIGALGPFLEADEQRLRRVFEVNFFAPVALTRAALPLLREGRQPLVANIGSVLGHFAAPRKSEYSASKFALRGFTSALRIELRPLGVDVLLVSPSTTASEFFEQAMGDGPDRAAAHKRAMPASQAARLAIRAMERGRSEVVLSASGKLGVWTSRLAPGLLDRLMARYAP